MGVRQFSSFDMFESEPSALQVPGPKAGTLELRLLAALGHSRSAEFARTGHCSDEGAIRSGTVLPFTLLRLARTA